jgi:hypothetical protein
MRSNTTSTSTAAPAHFAGKNVMSWQRPGPPYFWPAMGEFVAADRHLPGGTRQHVVRGIVPPGLAFRRARIVSETDCPCAK